jgi:Zn-dependent alcohol dehydrogenase
LPLNRLIGDRGSLDDVQKAFDDLRAGSGLRTVLTP